MSIYGNLGLNFLCKIYTSMHMNIKVKVYYGHISGVGYISLF
jgi:hypothetical protein